ncbi:hypothetical protein BS50DRAFT_323774 [Corynespora cassiicola Philippines]|uniref:Uncharacterized protein n=1 Tax=Corynespora cassiicola Philippines TaxID=1448308 RepID=A0A2T2NTH8_CORCC|nr:hypothetical protein BS50DRAFT_323774 [Corynespora cassiicola Philippines]
MPPFPSQLFSRHSTPFPGPQQKGESAGNESGSPTQPSAQVTKKNTSCTCPLRHLSTRRETFRWSRPLTPQSLANHQIEPFAKEHAGLQYQPRLPQRISQCICPYAQGYMLAHEIWGQNCNTSAVTLDLSIPTTCSSQPEARPASLGDFRSYAHAHARPIMAGRHASVAPSEQTLVGTPPPKLPFSSPWYSNSALEIPTPEEADAVPDKESSYFAPKRRTSSRMREHFSLSDDGFAVDALLDASEGLDEKDVEEWLARREGFLAIHQRALAVRRDLLALEEESDDESVYMAPRGSARFQHRGCGLGDALRQAVRALGGSRKRQESPMAERGFVKISGRKEEGVLSFERGELRRRRG